MAFPTSLILGSLPLMIFRLLIFLREYMTHHILKKSINIVTRYLIAMVLL